MKSNIDTVLDYNLTDFTNQLDLTVLDATVEAAINNASTNGLKIIGYGEVTFVFSWPTEKPCYAVKRLHTFLSLSHFEAYKKLLTQYMMKMNERGISVLDSQVCGVLTTNGTVRGYIIQPLIPKEHLLTYILRICDEQQAEGLLSTIVNLIFEATDTELGIDAAIPNWALIDGTLATFDISIPWLRDKNGHNLIDIEHLSRAYPWCVRGLLKHILIKKFLDELHEPRKVIIDTASNLLRWDNAKWLDLFLNLANSHLVNPIKRKEVEAHYAIDLKLYPLMHKLRIIERWWKQKVLRQPYGMLLPSNYTMNRCEGE